MILKLILLAIFGIAMAHLEGVVVVYLRKALGMPDSESNKESIEKFPKRYLNIEMTREAATIVMLVIIAYLAGVSWIERGVFFLWTFALWIAPVWFPIGVSGLTIIIIFILVLTGIF